MGKKKDKIGEKYEAYKANFKGKDEIEILENAANLEKEINGKEKALVNIKTEEGKEKLQEELKRLRQEYENLLGYAKHKDEIERIKEIKDRMNSKLQTKKEYQKTIKEELDNYIKQNISKYNEAKKNIKTASKGLGEVDNNTLYEAEEFKKEFEKTVRSYTTKLKKLEKEMKGLPIAIDKCDLAWRSLFANKSWDEISLRATSMNYTGKNIDDLKSESKKVAPIINETAKEVKEEKVELKTPIIMENVKDNIKNESEKDVEEQRKPIEYSEKPLTEEEEEELDKEEKALVERKHKSIFERIGTFFKNGFNKVVDFFFVEEIEEEIEEEIKEEVKEEVKQEVKEEVKQEVKEEVKQEVKQEMPVRDAFIEKLYVEVNHEKAKPRNDEGTYNKPSKER